MPTKKHNKFVSDPRGSKSVTELAGIGNAYGSRLKSRGYSTAEDLREKFEECGDKRSFQSWMKNTCGANSRWASDCYDCLADSSYEAPARTSYNSSYYESYSSSNYVEPVRMKAEIKPFSEDKITTDPVGVNPSIYQVAVKSIHISADMVPHNVPEAVKPGKIPVSIKTDTAPVLPSIAPASDKPSIAPASDKPNNAPADSKSKSVSASDKPATVVAPCGELHNRNRRVVVLENSHNLLKLDKWPECRGQFAANRDKENRSINDTQSYTNELQRQEITCLCKCRFRGCNVKVDVKLIREHIEHSHKEMIIMVLGNNTRGIGFNALCRLTNSTSRPSNKGYSCALILENEMFILDFGIRDKVLYYERYSFVGTDEDAKKYKYKISMSSLKSSWTSTVSKTCLSYQQVLNNYEENIAVFPIDLVEECEDDCGKYRYKSEIIIST